jgi:hypothetical protein
MKKETMTTGWINSNFRIKVYGVDAEGNKVNRLYGVSGIIALIGETLFFKFLKRGARGGKLLSRSFPPRLLSPYLYSTIAKSLTSVSKTEPSGRVKERVMSLPE